jgi:hypothetical protein
VAKLYFRHAHLARRRCKDATYASRTLNKQTRQSCKPTGYKTF